MRGAGGSSKTLSDAFERYLTIIFQHQVDVTRIDEEEEGKPWLRKLVVNVSSADEVLQLNTSEEYGLQVPAAVADEEESGLAAYLEAETVYGAVRGLETLSQLCVFNFTSKSVEVADAPWRIQDRPRFRYRGLLIDTGRHFQPVKIIKEVLDAMSYAKLNVLHWHLVDEEAFPLEVPSRPKLWEGAYSSQERYTLADAAEVVEYARQRGIHVMPEIDVPGHAASWGRGYPELWPSQTCQEPLDVSNNFTFETVDAILADLRAVFPFELFHLGGDEVDPSCWEHVPRVRSWLKERGLSGRQAYAGFVVRAQQLAAARGWDPVNWEEPFNLFPTALHRRTVVHNWWAPGLAPRIVQAGFRCIVSNQDVWYLDHLDVPWEAFYLNEPLKGVADEAGAELVIGGEVCMWGETVDASDIQQTIWPRAAAAAERLWSPRAAISVGPVLALPRLEHFRCLLNLRGVASAPVSNRLARTAPSGPGSCLWQ